jgi:hypothetical protein
MSSALLARGATRGNDANHVGIFGVDDDEISTQRILTQYDEAGFVHRIRIGIVMAKGSSKTAIASAKSTPCFATLAMAFLASHS